MSTSPQKNAVKALGLLIGLSCVLGLQPALKAGVVVLQNGTVINPEASQAVYPLSYSLTAGAYDRHRR